EYDSYCAAEIERYIQANPADFEVLKNAKADEERKMRPTSWPGLIEAAAKIAARSAIRKKLLLPTFEEFVDRKKQGQDFSLKPVGVSPVSDPAYLKQEGQSGTPELAAEIPAETDFAVDTLPHGPVESSVGAQVELTLADGGTGNDAPVSGVTSDLSVTERGI